MGALCSRKHKARSSIPHTEIYWNGNQFIRSSPSREAISQENGGKRHVLPTESTANLAKTLIKSKKTYKTLLYTFSEAKYATLDTGDNDQNPENQSIHSTTIKGFLNSKGYVAAEGIKADKVRAIWDLTWQCQSNRIVMLSYVEEGKMSGQYWPKLLLQTEKYGDYTVTLKLVLEYADYVTRVFHLRKGIHCRLVYHFQFSSWEEDNRPVYGAYTLINFLKRVHAVDHESAGPLIVHSDSGSCRIGTCIAFDIMLQEITVNGRANIPRRVFKLLQQRPSLLPTEDQYMFLIEAVLDIERIKSTTYPARLQAADFIAICNSFDEGGNNQLVNEFEVLCKLKLRNTVKTKYNQYLPAGFTHVDSFRKHDYYMVTRMPRADELHRFWHLVYHYQVRVIVMLTHSFKGMNPKEYWPNKATRCYGSMSVTFLSVKQIYSCILLREFKVESSSEKAQHLVVHYQLLGWEDCACYPPNKDGYLFLVKEICQWQLTLTRRQELQRSQMIIHCSNGLSRSAVFCAATHIIEDIDVNGEVNAMLAARIVARNNMNYINKCEEYDFLYKIARLYLSKRVELTTTDSLSLLLYL